MPYNRSTYAQWQVSIIADIDARLTGADARLPKSDLAITATVQAAAAYQLEGYGQWISRQILDDSADEDQLVIMAADWDIRPKAATCAAGTVTMSGAAGAVIRGGTVLQWGGMDYAVDATVQFAGATADVAVTALVAGTAGNVPAGATLTLVSPVDGVQTRGVAGDISGGLEAEDPASLLARLLERKRNPPQGGNGADYRRWAMETPGVPVTRVWVYNNLPAPGCVLVYIACDGRDDIIPTAAEVAAVQAWIDREDKRPWGGECFVRAPVPVAIDLEIAALAAADGYDQAAVRSAIVAELRAMIGRDAAPGATIYQSRLQAAISRAAGEYHHSLVSPAGNIAVAANEMAVLGVVTWS